MTSISFRLTMSSKFVVTQGAAPRSFAGSLTRQATTSRGAPARPAIRSPLAWSISSTPVPTVPRPRRPILKLLSLQHEQRVAFLHDLSVLREAGVYHASGRGFDLVEDLHRLDDSDNLADGNAVARLHKRILIRRRPAVENANHRARNRLADNLSGSLLVGGLGRIR